MVNNLSFDCPLRLLSYPQTLYSYFWDLGLGCPGYYCLGMGLPDCALHLASRLYKWWPTASIWSNLRVLPTFDNCRPNCSKLWLCNLSQKPVGPLSPQWFCMLSGVDPGLPTSLVPPHWFLSLLTHLNTPEATWVPHYALALSETSNVILIWWRL